MGLLDIFPTDKGYITNKMTKYLCQERSTHNPRLKVDFTRKKYTTEVLNVNFKYKQVDKKKKKKKKTIGKRSLRFGLTSRCTRFHLSGTSAKPISTGSTSSEVVLLW